MRTLSWKHTLGLVTMDVELADRTLSVAVTPVQAVVLLYRPSHHPGSTLGSSTSDTAPSSPACAGLLLLCRGFLRLLEVLSWGQGEKRGRGGPEGWSWTLFLAPSSSPSRSNQNYWKHEISDSEEF